MCALKVNKHSTWTLMPLQTIFDPFHLQEPNLNGCQTSLMGLLSPIRLVSLKALRI